MWTFLYYKWLTDLKHIKLCFCSVFVAEPGRGICLPPSSGARNLNAASGYQFVSRFFLAHLLSIVLHVKSNSIADIWSVSAHTHTHTHTHIHIHTCTHIHTQTRPFVVRETLTIPLHKSREAPTLHAVCHQRRDDTQTICHPRIPASPTISQYHGH